jgi:outer membrane biogenesis lipoprotein LolB
MCDVSLFIKKVTNMKYFLLFLVGMILSGCTVGRYVTNVASRGPGKLSIEKCTTKMYFNFYWNEECGETTITLPTPSTK